MLGLPLVLSALATLVAGAALPRAAPASYKLKTHVVRGNHTLGGLYVEPFHTGAGTNAVSLDTDATGSPAGSLTNGTYQTFVLGQYPYSFALDNDAPYYPPEAGVPAAAAPPAGYNVVTLNVGFAQPGFAVARGKLAYTGAGFGGFAACYVAGISPYESVGPEVQLLWRNATAGAPSGRCAEVELKVVAV